MTQATTIFLAGIGGVFTGMGLLYIAIRLTSRVTAPLENKPKDKSK